MADIQEYYELTLLNDTKSVDEKTQETNQVVSRWEKNPPILINTTSNNNNSVSFVFVFKLGYAESFKAYLDNLE